MSTRWALSPRDHNSHVVDEQASAEGVVVGMCGHRMPAWVDTGASPAEGGAMCTPCAGQLLAAAAAPPVHPHRPDAGGLHA